MTKMTLEQALERFGPVAIDEHLVDLTSREHKIYEKECSIDNDITYKKKQLATLRKRESAVKRFFARNQEEKKQKIEKLDDEINKLYKERKGLRPMDFYILAIMRKSPSFKDGNAKFTYVKGPMAINIYYAEHQQDFSDKNPEGLNNLAQALKMDGYAIRALHKTKDGYQNLAI